MSTDTNSNELSIADTRAQLAYVVNAAAVHGQITYLTNRSRRVAAIVPLAIAEKAERESRITP
ncbi:hypothetical protein [Actinoplanes solisilvae]|uniref:hypothetical protein n=1 Tax=Actinoplanes solisilvae TaxID=2486853 RepID=UPI000FD85537|nr:hypothetical protein [Actinoplanes solisilvae]